MLKHFLPLLIVFVCTLSTVSSHGQFTSADTNTNLELETPDQYKSDRNQQLIVGSLLLAGGAGVATMDLSDRKTFTGGAVISAIGIVLLKEMWVNHRKGNGKWTPKVERKAARVKARAEKKSKTNN